MDRGKKRLIFGELETKYILAFFPLFILCGKILRWTVMRETLINRSIGFGYIDPILNASIPFRLISFEEMLDGIYGIGNNTIIFFKFIRFIAFQIPETFAGFEIFITLLWGVMTFLMLTRLKWKLPFGQFIYIVISVIVLSVYCFTLGKEPMQMVYFFLAYLVLGSKSISWKSKAVGTFGVVFFSALTFRAYYILLFYFGAFFYFCIRKSVRHQVTTWKRVLLVYLVMVAAYTILMFTLHVFDPGLYQRMENSLLVASTATSNSNTYMENIICTGTGENVLLVCLEYALAILRMLFPFELLPLGIKYWPYIVYQIMITMFSISKIVTYEKNNKVQNIALSLIIGFIFTSVTFEVDFGAWVRHEVVTMPVVLFMIGCVDMGSQCYNDTVLCKKAIGKEVYEA